MIAKVQKKDGDFAYINPDQIERIAVLDLRYSVTMPSGFSFYADKSDPIITGLITAADAG